MYDASCAAPPRPVPYALVTAGSLAATFVIVCVMTHAMLLPANPVIPALAGALGMGTALALCVHFRPQAFDGILGVAVFTMLAYLISAGAFTMRADHEIAQERYDQIASTLRSRPELSPLLTAARADGVITNGERDRFHEDVAAFDRSKALGR